MDDDDYEGDVLSRQLSINIHRDRKKEEEEEEEKHQNMKAINQSVSQRVSPKAKNAFANDMTTESH